MANPYPIPGFHFSVIFDKFSFSKEEREYVKVSGLSVNSKSEAVNSDQEPEDRSNMTYGSSYGTLVLERAYRRLSPVTNWCKLGVELNQKNKIDNLLAGVAGEKLTNINSDISSFVNDHVANPDRADLISTNFNLLSSNITISLMNENKIPLSTWYVIGALPIGWEISDFDALDSNSFLREKMTFQYKFFNIINI